MTSVTVFLAVILGLFLCAPVYSEPQTIDEMPGYNVTSNFAGLQWESSVEQVEASLSKKGYSLSKASYSSLNEDGTPEKQDSFYLKCGKYLFGQEATVYCDFEGGKLWSIRVRFYKLELLGAWRFTQKVSGVLVGRYGKPAADYYFTTGEVSKSFTISEASNFAKEQKDLKELHAKLVWVGPDDPVFERNRVINNPALDLSLNRGVVSIDYRSPQLNKSATEKSKKIRMRLDREDEERAKRHKKDADDF